MLSSINQAPIWLKKERFQAWLVVSVSALFFFYEFIQMNMFNSLNNSLESTFHLSAFEVACVACFYFLADSILLYPTGALLDYISSKYLLLFGMTLCITGTLLITLADNSWFLIAARLLAGTSSAFCLLSILRLASQWFPQEKMGQITGVVVTLGMLGGAASQTPLVWLIQDFGWRNALRVVAALGIVILIGIIVIVKDAPREKNFALLSSQLPTSERRGFWEVLNSILHRPNNWLVGLYIATMNLPIILLAGLFGTKTLEQIAGLTQTQGATASMMLFIGTIVGSTFFGFISDLTRSRKKPMLTGALISMMLCLMIVYLPITSYLQALFLFLFLGFFTSTQIVGYAVTRESNPMEILGSAMGFISVLIVGIPVFLQPLMGWILTLGFEGKMINGMAWYPLQAYQHALMILVIGCMVSLLCALALPETYGKGINKK